MWRARTGSLCAVISRSTCYIPPRRRPHALAFSSSRATPDDASSNTDPDDMLEPWTAAYDAWDLASSQVKNESNEPMDNLPCARIRKLIVAGDFERAEAIRNEFTAQGISIAKHMVYEEAALDALRASRFASFRYWWTHVPDRALMPGGRSFDDLLTALAAHGHAATMTMIKFVMLAASKGWLREVQLDLIPYIVHTARPAYSLAVIAGALENAERYVADHPDDPWVHASLRKASLVGAALHMAILDGRRNLALMIVEVGFLHNCCPPHRLLHFLLRELKKSVEFAALERARELIAQHLWLIGRTVYELEHFDSRPRTYISAGPFAIREPLPVVLRVMSRITGHEPPRATAIAHFLTRYTRVGRMRAVQLLRRKIAAFAPDARPLSLWLTAELKFWMLHGRHDRAIQYYAAYFLPHGVPKAIMTSFLKLADDPEHTAKYATEPYLDKLQPMPRRWRIWPSSHSQALLWSAFARASPDLQTLEWVYQGLLQIVGHFRTVNEELAGARMQEIMDALSTHAHEGARPQQMSNEAAAEEMENEESWRDEAPKEVREGYTFRARDRSLLAAQPETDEMRRISRRGEDIGDDDPFPDAQEDQSDYNADVDFESPSPKTNSLPPILMPDAAYFVPFIIRFGALGGPQRALQVLRDMSDRDIAPGVQTWYFLAREYAARNDPDGVRKIITHTESLAKPDFTVIGLHRSRARTRFGALRASEPEYHPVEGPTLPFYHLLLGLYMRKSMWREVDSVLDDMESKGYTPGYQPRFDPWAANARGFYAERLEREGTVPIGEEAPVWVPAGDTSEYKRRWGVRKRFVRTGVPLAWRPLAQPPQPAG